MPDYASCSSPDCQHRTECARWRMRWSSEWQSTYIGTPCEGTDPPRLFKPLDKAAWALNSIDSAQARAAKCYVPGDAHEQGRPGTPTEDTE